MYVFTFYSFKGGVGRTMALVNVAAELVRRGRKVLVVDFDLEAPGLETYQRLQPEKPHPGIVEYVTEFRRNLEVPNLLDYIYETKPIGKKGGRLWVMPAGRRDSAYRKALANLDWQRLYKDEAGFLLFEDTKKGWEEELKPDYVLIDSRTGDTDVLGICTRQLPDSVVLMFTPNEQNLAGLENVCRDIRREETEGLKKKIKLHFVAANVPDLDDERGILRRQMQGFKEKLEFEKFLRTDTEEFAGVIRRYENLSLLDQSIFILDRPRSRLARSYRRLLGTFIKENPADPDGVRLFLRWYEQRYLPNAWSRSFSVEENVEMEVMRRLAEPNPSYESDDFNFGERRRRMQDDERFDQITKHLRSDDAHLMFEVAECQTLRGNLGQAIAPLNQALNGKPDYADALFLRGLCNKKRGYVKDAADDLCQSLRRTGRLEDKKIVSALRELRAIAPSRVQEVAGLPTIQNLRHGEKREACEILADSPEGLPHAISLIRNRVPGDLFIEIEPFLNSFLIRAGRWREVIGPLEGKNYDNLGAGELFDLAMAYWGESGALRADLCRRALEKDGGRRHKSKEEQLRMDVESDKEKLRMGVERGNDNGRPFSWDHFGADWLLEWGAGNVAEALRRVETAEEDVRAGRRRPFSIWHFQEVSPGKFLDDAQLLRRMFQGEPLRPAFLGPPPS